MEDPIRYESTQEPLDDEERELMNPDSWDWDNPIEGVTVGDPKLILNLEFTINEVRSLDALVAAAHTQGLSTEEFIKRAAIDAIHAVRT